MLKENTEFSKAIIKYFMDFLETDFHKRRLPKRKITYTNSDKLVVGCNLNRYPKFEEKLTKLLNNKIETITIKKNEFISNVNETLISQIIEILEKTSGEDIKYINRDFVKDIKYLLENSKDTKSIIIDKSVNKLSSLIENRIVEKVINNSEDILNKMGILEQEFITLNESLSEMILGYCENELSEILNKNISDFDIISIKNISAIFKEFFSNIIVADLYNDIGKLISSKKILDKQELYFSIFDITYKKNKYPLFYLPFSAEETIDSVTINFDAQMYINKKAIEFIMQEAKEKLNLIGKIESLAERILYLSNIEKPMYKIKMVVNDILNYLSLSESFDDKLFIKKRIKNSELSISNSLYFNVFDKSDDALVNDYEELLQLLNQEDSDIAQQFNEIIEEFMAKEPKSITKEIEDDWDSQTISEKLVFRAPIPLNEEQIKILNSLNNENCKYLMVQGPPGTGKSHTITAIVFDMILKGKSVLVLSDKKEALDVVEDKITSTLNKVRTNNEFQNPILRLGKTGNTYSQILSPTSIQDIKLHHKVYENEKSQITKEINTYMNEMKEDIIEEEAGYERIKIRDILEFEFLDKELHDKSSLIDIKEFEDNELTDDILDILSIIKFMKEQKLQDKIDHISTLYGFVKNTNILVTDNLDKLSRKIFIFNNLINNMNLKYPEFRTIIKRFEKIDDKSFEKIIILFNEYQYLSNRIIWSLFNKKKLKELINQIAVLINDFDLINFENELKSIGGILEIREYVESKLPDDKINHKFLLSLLKIENLDSNLLIINDAKEKCSKLIDYRNKYPFNFRELNFDNLNEINIKYSHISEDEYLKVARYITLKNDLYLNINKLKISKYLSDRDQLQNNITLETASILDGRVIDFYENNRNTAKLLRKIIQNKSKFPKDDFFKLKEAFPCILAGIRDYSEYIPLEKDLFDLVIIDEASQVSIAQSLTALIRAKKVLVLGDKKQFSNVKSNQAKTEINTEYKSRIKEKYLKSSFYKTSYELKLENFDIKSSVLDFFEAISNYQTMLFKYFRGYKEIISYSNNYFYNNKLQVMKIRGKNIDDVIKFEYVKHDGALEYTPKTNLLEVELVIEKLQELLKNNYQGSVGIITPHTNQQKLLYTEIRKLPEYIDLEKSLNLKIMTFDSCQGEERDIIYYSMVAHSGADSLWGVFAKDFNNIDMEEEGKLRAQRLNVGFSRAKECMNFIVSKSLNEYNGEIGNALRHYSNIIELAKKEKSPDETDPKSQMESKVLDWFYQTKFWRQNSDCIEFMPQFELGKYLKQLDNTYKHPLYCVDFLLLIRNNNGEKKIIIEYDGFKEHFETLMEIDNSNYEDYLKPEDIYRQKVLESYGYLFLRINKFNIGKNPVESLNSRLNEILNGVKKDNTYLKKFGPKINGLKDGSLKECIKCEKILDLSEFKDPTLTSGIGRICKSCKEKEKVKVKVIKSKKTISNGMECPLCDGRLVVRNGRYGRFLGCSSYPYCSYSRSM